MADPDIVCFLQFSFFMAVLQSLFSSDKRMEKRIKRYLDLQNRKKLSAGKFKQLVQLQLYKQTIREKVLSKSKTDKLKNMLQSAGVPLKPEEYILFQWIAAALGGGLLYLLSGRFFFLLIGAVVGYLLPKWLVARKERERISKFNDGLQDMITTIIGSLRAGFSFTQALKTVMDEASSPIQEEIEMVLREMQYGSSMEDALHELKERMPSEDLDLMIQAILIQRQIGGNLATVLETIVQTIRDRSKIQRQIQTLTAQGRLSGMVIGLLPIVLGVLIYMIEPEYIGALFNHPVGMLMLACGAISGIIGFVFIRKLTTIEV
ncbi:type II secretion system F family protein [Paenibacillus hexagrammi]|uniref:Type II secretion system F family protein n=1 Tax=Paenibacillus hexagrammi TaxID=2908839 RepID=A0ABY3SFP6_9BACL|nr:type II secretion system F family protein [Paenibacillus sp. YPD9-1]UJF32834.1 type II secretion system F family protein [Paenibacillus sp. YPD9-1]